MLASGEMTLARVGALIEEFAETGRGLPLVGELS